MKVGIYFPGNLPESGGAYTYEYELLCSFLSLVHESHHEFCILSNINVTNVVSDFSRYNISNAIIPRNSLVARIFKKILVRQVEATSSLNKVIADNDIEVLLSLIPITEPVDCPYITPLWDLQHRLQPWFPEVSKNGLWSKRENHYSVTLRRAMTIVTGTLESQSEISSFYGIPKERIKVLPMPTPDYCISTQQRRNRGNIKQFNINGSYLFYPAQFWPHKNHVNCIRALKILRHKYEIPLSLVFVGSDKGNLSYMTDFISEQGLNTYVHILGFLSRDDIISLYQNAFALIFPTFFGPDNLPPLEAFALGCPVVASNVLGADEQFGNAALLFNPSDPDEIAKAIATLFHNPTLRMELIDRGYQRAVKWTGKDYMRAILSILDEFENIRISWKT